METKMTMIYWKGEKFWLGKLLEHPEIMTQGETLTEIGDNIKDAYLLMAMDEVPEEHQMKKVAIFVHPKANSYTATELPLHADLIFSTSGRDSNSSGFGIPKVSRLTSR